MMQQTSDPNTYALDTQMRWQALSLACGAQGGSAAYADVLAAAEAYYQFLRGPQTEKNPVNLKVV